MTRRRSRLPPVRMNTGQYIYQSVIYITTSVEHIAMGSFYWAFSPSPKVSVIYLLLLLPPTQSRHQTGHERCRISQLSSSNLPLCHCTNPTTSQSSHDRTRSCSVPRSSLSSCDIQPWSIHRRSSRTHTSFMHCTRMVSKVSPSYNTLRFLHVLY